MALDPKVIYWTGAWLNMAAIVGLALWGVRSVRRNDVVRHRRYMLIATLLVGGFLLSYGVKLATLGREALSSWDAFYVSTLRFHESCIAVMVVAGVLALHLARRLRLREARDGSRGAYGERTAARLRLHRVAGRTAIAGAVVGLLSAGVVLYGMYARAGAL
jgi:uncharacterized membrane protein YozB (DUF420 family)